MQQKKKNWKFRMMAKVVENTMRRKERKRKRNKNTMKKNITMERILQEVRI